MDIRFTEQQEIMKRNARDFLTSRFPKSLAKELVLEDRDFPKDLWREMADLGWMELILPPSYGGAGGSIMDLVVLLEEMGRACLPSIFFSTVVLGGLTIMEAGNEQHKKELLPKIVRGDIIVTLAMAEVETDFDLYSSHVTARAEGDNYVINGTKLFVTDAHIADFIICPAKTKRQATADPGITLFIINSKAQGVSIAPLKTIGGDKQCEVTFNEVKAHRENVLGEVNHGWTYLEKVLQKAAVAKCAEMVGGAQQVLEMTVSYAKERVQFRRPIGAFQAIQHHCTNMLAYVECSRWVTYKAAWMIDEGMAYDTQASIAKAWCSEAYRRVVALGHQVIGGVGYILDHDMPLYFRHVRSAEVALGDHDFHRKLVADSLFSGR